MQVRAFERYIPLREDVIIMDIQHSTVVCMKSKMLRFFLIR